MDYKHWDADDLRTLLEDVERAIDLIHSAESALDDYEFTNKATVLDSLADAVNDLLEEMPDIQAAVADANKREFEEEMHDYWEAVGL